jgi:hypothetical protein
LVLKSPPPPPPLLLKVISNLVLSLLTLIFFTRSPFRLFFYLQHRLLLIFHLSVTFSSLFVYSSVSLCFLIYLYIYIYLSVPTLQRNQLGNKRVSKKTLIVQANICTGRGAGYQAHHPRQHAALLHQSPAEAQAQCHRWIAFRSGCPLSDVLFCRMAKPDVQMSHIQHYLSSYLSICYLTCRFHRFQREFN